MRNGFRRLTKSPFVLFTSIAALIHSSWTLAMVFGGKEPPISISWLGWIIPGFLLAASIDVGLLDTSWKIEDGDRSKARLITFIVLAISMFFLQFFYVETHFPLVPLAEGIPADWTKVFALIRDAMSIIVPLLLPLAISLHTFANTKVEKAMEGVVTETALAIVPAGITAKCQFCNWTRNFDSGMLAQRALDLHQKSCEGLRIELPSDQTKLLK